MDVFNSLQMDFTIPKSTPPGKYLLRAEHLNVKPIYNGAEMYINRAHVEITGSGGGTMKQSLLSFAFRLAMVLSDVYFR